MLNQLYFSLHHPIHIVRNTLILKQKYPLNLLGQAPHKCSVDEFPVCLSVHWSVHQTETYGVPLIVGCSIEVGNTALYRLVYPSHIRFPHILLDSHRI